MTATALDEPGEAPGPVAPSPPGTVRPRRLGRRGRRRLIVLGVVLAVFAAAGAFQARKPESRSRLASEGAAPAFDLPRLGAPSERVRLESFRGTPVVVNFWASWCVPCRKEMPVLQAVSAQLRGQVAFVGVNHQDGRSAATSFEASTGVGYPSGYDPEGTVGSRFGVYGLPTTILVAADGTIVGRRLGEVSRQELRDLIRAAFGIDAPLLDTG